MGKKNFTNADAKKIRGLLKEKIHATRLRQNLIRYYLRSMGFYISDFTDRLKFSEKDFDTLVKNGKIIIDK